MDAIKVTNVRELLVRKPYDELTPSRYMKHSVVSDVVPDYYYGALPVVTMYRRIKTKADFLSE